MIIPCLLSRPGIKAMNLLRRSLGLPLILSVLVSLSILPLHAGQDGNNSALQQIEVVTADFPPYSYLENGRAEGVAVTKARRVFRQLGIDPEIKVFPWSRAYAIAKNKPNVLLFSMARSEEREQLFHWVGQITNFHVKVFRLKSRRDIVAETPQDLAGYRVGSLLKDVKGDYLKDKGIQPVVYSSEENGIRMLFLGRIDAMPADEQSFIVRVKKLGYSMDDIEIVLPLEDISKPLFMAFNRETPISVVTAFRDALQAVTGESSEGN
jgi:polar amino acid transport system substrate-binding protein